MKFRLKRGWRYAREDKIILQKWYYGEISTEKAIMKIAENNQCDEVPEEDFLKFAEGLGYERKRSKKSRKQETEAGTEG